MSLVTIVEDTSDVGFIRNMLTQAGVQHTKVREDDMLVVFNQTTLYADFANIVDVAGVWLPDDITHSGTNYASGASVYPAESKIVLTQPIPSAYTDVLITYATRDGLSDTQVQVNIDIAKSYVQMELWETSINYSGSSTYQMMARHCMLNIASYYSLLAMNNGNAIQAGYNYRIAEFEIQTKLWGEGMIAETLLKAYWERAMKMLNILKLYQAKPDVPIYVVDRSNSRVKYNADPNIFNTRMTMNRIRLNDSRSEYGIIMKIIG